jgi:uncharacterized membrane protein YraQ (UPF0718 family)
MTNYERGQIIGQILGVAVVGLGIGGIAGYLSKRYWVAAIVGAAVCLFVSGAPIFRVASAITCVALVGLFIGLRKLSAMSAKRAQTEPPKR